MQVYHMQKNENELGNHIRYNRKIVSANWSSLEKRWEVTAKLTEGGEEEHFKMFTFAFS